MKWQLLEHALRRSIENRTFQFEKFFPIWFRELGTPYFFLFKKNLSITNISHAELVALIRDHASITGTNDTAAGLAFHTTFSFKEAIERIVEPLLTGPDVKLDELPNLAQLYWPVVERSIVVDQFYTSCAIFLPPGLHIDLISICGESGYINSCGYSLYIRKVSKATQGDFYDSIDRHLKRFPEYVGNLQFIPYEAHDFGDDKDTGFMRAELQDGLEGVKIRITKLHMQNEPMVRILQDMEDAYKGKLLFWGAGSYKRTHPKTSDCTLWLIHDHGIKRSAPAELSSDGYYICYHQLYFNDNPFHAFDENKPAWLAHNTIPHTLVGAMMNLTKPWSSKRTITIRDPFGGSGTTWLETLKYANARCISSDISAVSPRIVADNVHFFSLSPVELVGYLNELQKLIAALGGKSEPPTANDDSGDLFGGLDIVGLPPAYERAMAIIERLGSRNSKFSLAYDVTAEDGHLIEELSLFERLVFYIALRAELRNQLDFARGAKRRSDGFCEEAKYLVEELSSLRKWLENAASERTTVGAFSVFSGHYSKACGLQPKRINAARKTVSLNSEVEIADAVKIPPKSCDVVVCDPPYGVNTVEDQMEFAELYSRFVPALTAAVRDQGHLVICLPSQVHSGKTLPPCTNSQIVTIQVLQSAASLGREAYSVSRSGVPMTIPPYYWNSRALSRTILHFRIRDKSEGT